MLPPVTVPMQTGAYMMPQAGTSGIFVLLMIFAFVFFLIPIILFFIMIYKARRSVADWHGMLSSDDFKGMVEEQRETSKKFIDNINELLSLRVERERKKK